MELTQEQIEFLDKVSYGDWTLNSKGEVDVNGSVDIRNMKLTEIPVKFGSVIGYFLCYDNQITTLKNCPNWVGQFSFHSNNITSLDYFPDYINDFKFYCSNNPLKDYFKNIKEEDFKHWKKMVWKDILKEYPFLINICRKYVNKRKFISLIKEFPKTKLYLR